MNKEGKPSIVNQENSESEFIFNEIKTEYEKLRNLEEELLQIEKDLNSKDKTGQPATFVLNASEGVKIKEIKAQKVVFDALVKKHEGVPGLPDFLKNLEGKNNLE